MGNCISRYITTTKTINDSNNDKFHELNICAFNVRLYQSTMYQEKIQKLINFIYTSKYDIICLHGIHDVKILKTIINKIHTHNNIDIKNKLITYPLIETFINNKQYDDVNDIIQITWSGSDNIDFTAVDSLIISRHEIITGSKINIPNSEKYFYVANINFNNIIISIYNTSFKNDFVGTSNSVIRKIEIDQLKDLIECNNENIKMDNFYDGYANRCIHVICCQANIVELSNNDINNEYLYFIRSLCALDTYRYIQTIKGKTINNAIDATNIGGSRCDYILVGNLKNDEFEHIENIEKSIYEHNKLLVVNSTIKPNIHLYEDYPIITSFYVEKNKII
jgi:hypothetical protein